MQNDMDGRAMRGLCLWCEKPLSKERNRIQSFFCTQKHAAAYGESQAEHIAADAEYHSKHACHPN